MLRHVGLFLCFHLKPVSVLLKPLLFCGALAEQPAKLGRTRTCCQGQAYFFAQKVSLRDGGEAEWLRQPLRLFL